MVLINRRVTLLAVLVTILFSSSLLPYTMAASSCSYEGSTSFISELKSDTCFQTHSTGTFSSVFHFSGISIALSPITISLNATTVSPASGAVTGVKFLDELAGMMKVPVPSSLLESPGPYKFYSAVVLEINSNLFPGLATTLCEVFCWVGITSQTKLAPLRDLTWPDGNVYLVFLLAFQSSSPELSSFISTLESANSEVTVAIKGLVAENAITTDALTGAVQFLLSEFDAVMYYSSLSGFVQAIDLATVLDESISLLSDVTGIIIGVVTADVPSVLVSSVGLIDMFLELLLPAKSGLLQTMEMVLTYVDPPKSSINLVVRNETTRAVILSPTQTVSNESGSNGLLFYSDTGSLALLPGTGKRAFNFTLQGTGNALPFFFRVISVSGNMTSLHGELSAGQTIGGLVGNSNGVTAVSSSAHSSGPSQPTGPPGPAKPGPPKPGGPGG